MPSKRSKYNLVEDAYDTRIPLHSDEAFQHGIDFQAKYIGTLDVPRPSSRVEIVAAMRRIRYEFKAKGIKKKKVNICISVEGIKVMQRKKKKRDYNWNEDKYQLMSHAIYRVFYVSHDSQDLKIFSYIARDGQTNIFKCNVFKSHKKSHAMRIVRSIGQAFEVCHKLSGQHNPAVTDGMHCDLTEKIPPDHMDSIDMKQDLSNADLDTGFGSINTSPTRYPGSPRQSHVATSPMMSGPEIDQASGIPPLSLYHQKQLLHHQLQQQEMQTQVALAQVQLLKDQLTAESSARLEAQARVQQMVIQNKELLNEHEQLVMTIHELETKLYNTNAAISAAFVTYNPGNPFTSPPPLSMGHPNQQLHEDNNIQLPEFSSMGEVLPNGPAPIGQPINRDSSKNDMNANNQHFMHRQSVSSFSDRDFGSRPVSGVDIYPDSLTDDMNRLNMLSDTNEGNTSPLKVEKRSRTANGNVSIIIPSTMQDATSNKLELGSNRNSQVGLSSEFSQTNKPNNVDSTVGSTNNSNSNSNYRHNSIFLSETSLDSNDLDGANQTASIVYRYDEEDSENNNQVMITLEQHEDMETPNLSAFEESADEEAKRRSVGEPFAKRAQLHISFSDDDNTENSEDSGVPRPPRAADSINFDDEEALVNS